MAAATPHTDPARAALPAGRALGGGYDVVGEDARPPLLRHRMVLAVALGLVATTLPARAALRRETPRRG